MRDIQPYLERLSAFHNHVCPRQVLGVRMGLFAADLLSLNVPQTDKRLFTIVETDGCFVDGLSVSTGCSMGHRTMRLIDFGKVAATFVDTDSGKAIRVSPRSGCREEARRYAPDARSSWHAQLQSYQIMPDEELLIGQSVALSFSLDRLLSQPGHRTVCQCCGEEILNEREIVRDGAVLCLACAGQAYCHTIDEIVPVVGSVLSLST